MTYDLSTTTAFFLIMEHIPTATLIKPIYLSYILFYKGRLDRHGVALWNVWHAIVVSVFFFFCFCLYSALDTHPVMGVTGWRTRNFWAKERHVILN